MSEKNDDGPKFHGQIMPGSPFSAYRVERKDPNGQVFEVGWIFCANATNATREVWQLYGPNVSGGHKAPYVWPSDQNVQGSQSREVTTIVTYHSNQNAIIDLGGVGGANYTQIEAICSVMSH